MRKLLRKNRSANKNDTSKFITVLNIRLMCFLKGSIASLLGVWLSVFSMQATAQVEAEKKLWETLLKDVKVRNAYSVKYKEYLPFPRFGKKLKKLHGKKITLRGFYLPYNENADTCIISYNPMSSCFFCTGSGIETILEAIVAKDHVEKFKKLKTDNIIKVTGVLRLNRDTYEDMMYILDDVELLEIIK